MQKLALIDSDFSSNNCGDMTAIKSNKNNMNPTKSNIRSMYSNIVQSYLIPENPNIFINGHHTEIHNSKASFSRKTRRLHACTCKTSNLSIHFTEPLLNKPDTVH